eukprot:GILK01004046.1.p1 GENE.GILK01004046.1~~GILK01004046.1.p1  ORF type:complete len:1912 (-),score=378.64 GILK01004046.1:123-5405(-)
MAVMREFERLGGLSVLVSAAKDAIKQEKAEEKRQWLSMWIEEFETFLAVPLFSQMFMKNSNCRQILFCMISGAVDSIKISEQSPSTFWTYCYETLASVLRAAEDPVMRDTAIRCEVPQRVLRRLADITREPARQLTEETTREADEHAAIDASTNAEAVKTEKPTDKKKKGVGYGSDNDPSANQTWQLDDYVQSEKTRAAQITACIDVLCGLLHSSQWTPSAELVDTFLCSCLLPVIEAAFRSGSLIDMNKQPALFSAYLKLVRGFSQHELLLPLLQPLDKRYVPAQTESINFLLGKMKDLAVIFVQCLKSKPEEKQNLESLSETEKAEIEAAKMSEELCKNIQNTFSVIKNRVAQHHASARQLQVADVLALSLDEAYKILLSDLRFDYMNMKKDQTYKHHYEGYISSSSSTPPHSKMIRLAQELADISTGLPLAHTNSIFLRVDQNRVDVMKAVIMGASGTPYGDGAFEFDIFCDDSYPQTSPKVNLETTGGGTIRFNPNLYNCGKVCLSLLGTWRGQASENWDPKISTLLQVLCSIQALIMSEDVYFNEPGFEHEAGTDEGEHKNAAYANIVRYGNVKFAMVEQLRNPSPGFEEAIRRHFYVKRKEILKQVEVWLAEAKTTKASYTGLVYDHNSNWCGEFKNGPLAYHDKLRAAIEELKAEFKKLKPPKEISIRPENKATQSLEAAESAEAQNIWAAKDTHNTVDVTDTPAEQMKEREFAVDDAAVKDRWSRYIGAMGIEAVQKQANSNVFLSGASGLGIEIAKNIVLSGVKSFTLHDTEVVSLCDLSAQFFLREADVGKNRAEASIARLQELNYYVRVKAQTAPLDLNNLSVLDSYHIVVLCGASMDMQAGVDKYCRAKGILFIGAELYGVFSRVFVDFGDSFMVHDKDGEDVHDVMIGDITSENPGIVTCLAGVKHPFSDGDVVVFREVEGMEGINGVEHTVTVINRNKFKIGDTSTLPKYVRGGIARNKKLPKQFVFESFESSVMKPKFDEFMQMGDFMKLHHAETMHTAFAALDAFRSVYKGELPRSWDNIHADEVLANAEQLAVKFANFAEPNEAWKKLVRKLAYTSRGQLAPLCAYMGGLLAQEVIKGITGKFSPIHQWFYADASELLPDSPNLELAADDHMPIQDRLDGLRICVGQSVVHRLANLKLFMVGSGAIGCELLKNYAMMGVGCGEDGKIVLTDPDVIETSNLNRQFLFREKHLRQPKSLTAAAAAVAMNPALDGHVHARLDKVHDGTQHIFNAAFFESLDVVTNALDNVHARRYVDQRCVSSHRPLLESGTLGPKGHVQVIIPHKTESYSSQQDPDEGNEIPHCTLKMFPEETLHCVEWARDKFGKLFTQRPAGLLKVLEEPEIPVTSSQELESLRRAVDLLEKRPANFEDCVRFARLKFQKYFVNDIRQLLYVYPRDAKTKEGNPFWSLPKRPPQEIAFDANDILHAHFIMSAACLRAREFDIAVPVEKWTDEEKLKLAKSAAQFSVVDFVPSDEKAKAISAEVSKTEKKEQEQSAEDANKQSQEEVEESVPTGNAAETLLSKLSSITSAGSPTVNSEQFEKDDDKNYHIDFIYAMANLRAKNYVLEDMDWLTVKLKAGRIIPALATTTAAVSGLVCIELIKLVNDTRIEDVKNSFLNMAVPVLTQSEPGPAEKVQLTPDVAITLWDRWELQGDITLGDLFNTLQTKYSLLPRDVMKGTTPLFFHAIMSQPERYDERASTLQKKVSDLARVAPGTKYVDLTVTFASPEDPDTVLNATPVVRVYF